MHYCKCLFLHSLSEMALPLNLNLDSDLFFKGVLHRLYFTSVKLEFMQIFSF